MTANFRDRCCRRYRARRRQLMVLLHGYGSDGADLIGLGRAVARAVARHAVRCAQCADGVCAAIRGGYRVVSAADRRRIAGRIEGAERGAAGDHRRSSTISGRRPGSAPADTVLVGFSQGAMMALHVGTVARDGAGGDRGVFRRADPARWARRPAVPKPPVALIHGELDQVVDPALSRQAAERPDGARLRGFSCTFRRAPAHGIAPDGLAFARRVPGQAMAAKA